MKIVNKKTNNTVLISDIKDGECFMMGGELYMKVNKGDLTNDSEWNYPIVAINLETNKIETFRDITVEKVEAKIVIE